MKNKFFKRLFSLAIVVFMVVSMLPANVLAEGIATQSAAVDRDPDKNGCPHCEGEIEWLTFDKATHLDANRNFSAGGHYKRSADAIADLVTAHKVIGTAEIEIVRRICRIIRKPDRQFRRYFRCR